MKSLYYAGFVLGFVVVGNRVLRLIPNRLGQDFVVGLLAERLGPLGRLTDVQTAKFFSFVWELGVPFVVAIALSVVANQIMKVRQNGAQRDYS